MNNKWFWRLLLIISTILFIYSIFSKHVYLSILDLILVLIVNYKGRTTLFKDYDKMQEERKKFLNERRKI